MTRTTARRSRIAMLVVAIVVAGAAIAVSQTTGVAATPTTVSVSSVSIAEGDSGGTRTAKLLVSLSDKATSTVSVTATLTAGNATSGTDFTPWSAAKTLTFTSGQKTKTVSVAILADTNDEGNETATVTLGNASSSLSITVGTGTITIVDDDPGTGTGVAIGSASVSEGDTGGTRSISLPVTLNAKATSTLTVVATLSNGTATGGSVSPADYKPWTAAKTLTFTSGQKTKTVSVSIIPDTTAEDDQTAAVTLTNASSGLAIRTATGTVTIVNDDGTPPTCPTANFPDLSGAAGAGAGYAKPSVSVSCSATELKVTSNDMPSYTFTPITPNPLLAQSYNWHVPLTPTVASSSTSVSSWFGTVGFTVTGLPIYAAMEGAQPVQEQYGDPIYNGIVDTCKGHTGPAGEYHLHAMNTASSCGFTADPIVGYALDGFPIYGSNGCLDVACTQVVTFKSGWVRTGNPTTNAWSAYTYTTSSDVTVLDKCNGRIGPDGTYRYYATSGFPYTFGCFKGTPTTQTGGAAAAMPAMG